MKTHIRPLTPDDEPFLRTALYHALHFGPDIEPPSPDIVDQPGLARYVAGWGDRPEDLGFVAEVNGVPAGAAWLRRWRPGDRGYGFVDEATPELSISLLPAYRGRGLGTELFNRLLSEAAERYDAVSLSVSTSSPALQFYKRFGFTIIGEPEGGSVTMLKKLNTPGAR